MSSELSVVEYSFTEHGRLHTVSDGTDIFTYERIELENPQTLANLMNMNAVEIIQEIERLPASEKGKVVDFMRQLPNQETIEAMEEAKHPEKLEKFNSAADMFKKLGVEC